MSVADRSQSSDVFRPLRDRQLSSVLPGARPRTHSTGPLFRTQASLQSSATPHSGLFSLADAHLPTSPPSALGRRFDEKRSEITADRSVRSLPVSETVGSPVLVDVRQLPPRIISESITEGASRVIREVERERQRRTAPTPAERRIEPEIEFVLREKVIEVLREKPVPVERVIDVRYDVFIDVPVERTIEREVITEVRVEKPIQKTVEVTIEQIFEVEVERVFELPVPVVRRVEVPHVVTVTRHVDVLRENVIEVERVIDVDESEVGAYPDARVLPTVTDVVARARRVDVPRYVENVIVHDVPQPVERVVEVPVTRFVERRVPLVLDRPVPVDREIERVVEVPVEKIVERQVELRVEVPVVREHELRVDVPREVVRYNETEVAVELLVEKATVREREIPARREEIVQVPVPRELTTEVPVEIITEVPMLVECLREVPVEKRVSRPVARISRVETPVDFPVERTRLVERTVDLPVTIHRFAAVPREKEVEVRVPVERIRHVPRVTDVEVQLPVHIQTERVELVERTIERPQPRDMIVEKRVEELVITDVAVRVETHVDVPLTTTQQRLVVDEVVCEELVTVVLETTEPVFYAAESIVEFEDAQLEVDIHQRRKELQQCEWENKKLRREFEKLCAEQTQLEEVPFAFHAENAQLRLELALARERLEAARVVNDRLQAKSRKPLKVPHMIVSVDPKFTLLRSRFVNLLEENKALVEEALSRGRQAHKLVQAG